MRFIWICEERELNRRGFFESKMSLKSGSLGPKPSIFDKKPKNHGLRYKHVNSMCDTGASRSKVARQETNSQIARKRDELFKRVRIQKLAEHLGGSCMEKWVGGMASVYF